MPVMSSVEQLWCRSAPWQAFTGRVVLPWALRGVDLSGEVLEIGSGAGANAAELLRRYPRLQLTATDLDAAMVAAARRRLARFGPRATVTEADATGLPFDNGRFDAVVSLIMLHHVIAWEDAMTEAARVLRPGGVLVGYDLMHTGPARLLHRLDRSPHRLVAPHELRAQLQSAGFDAIDVSGGLGGLVARFRATLPDEVNRNETRGAP
jgi:SAM-dependent methyltransferase